VTVYQARQFLNTLLVRPTRNRAQAWMLDQLELGERAAWYLRWYQ
jgi:hypothetical protein